MMNRSFNVTINVAIDILTTINDKVKVAVENVDMREYDWHLPESHETVLTEYCATCDCALRSWYIVDGTVDITNPFYRCEEDIHHAVHVYELQRQHDMYSIEDECDPWWDYESDQPLE